MTKQAILRRLQQLEKAIAARRKDNEQNRAETAAFIALLRDWPPAVEAAVAANVHEAIAGPAYQREQDAPAEAVETRLAEVRRECRLATQRIEADAAVTDREAVSMLPQEFIFAVGDVLFTD